MASSGTASFRRQNQRARTKKRKKEKTRDQERHTTAPTRCICRPAAACLSPQPAVPTGTLCARASGRRLSYSLARRPHAHLLCHRPPPPRPVRIVKSRGSPGGIMPRPCPLRARGHGHGSSIPDRVRAGMHAAAAGPDQVEPLVRVSSPVLDPLPAGFLSGRIDWSTRLLLSAAEDCWFSWENYPLLTCVGNSKFLE